MLKKIPIDVSSFDILRNNNYVYVDKTYEIFDLISGGRYYFLSRPRRFGKSLLISTLKQLLLGKRELFKGLWIETNTTYDWISYPVIHLDFSVLPIENGQTLKNGLNWLLDRMAESVGHSMANTSEPSLKLIDFVQFLSRSNPVVILIDEYDSPIVNNLQNQKIAEENHLVLRNFYNTLKGLDSYLKFVLITGVTKYSKTSLFSGLNNLNDLSFDQRAASLLGYTKEEIKQYFFLYLEQFGLKEGKTVNEILDRLEFWYDGYRFSEKPVYVFNPFSVLYCLQKLEFSNFWFESGTPSFLIELLKKRGEGLEDIKEIELSSSALGPFDIGEEALIPILFQTGYLSIYSCEKSSDSTTKLFKLRYPNHEVSESFKRYLLAAHTRGTYRESEMRLAELASSLKSNKIDEFFKNLRSLLAQIPYHLHIGEEKYYHSLFQLIASLLHLDAQSEVATHKGRIDMVFFTKTHIYLFEIKLNSTPEAALRQIEELKYYEKFLSSKKRVTLVGVSFNTQKDKLSLDYQIKDLETFS